MSTRLSSSLGPRSRRARRPAHPKGSAPCSLAVDWVRSVDLHRYRAPLNLDPGCDAEAAWDGAARTIEAAWGAPAPLARLGGGTVEGYPEDAGAVPAGFLFNGALSTYEKLGFIRDRQIGKHRWVVTRVISRTECPSVVPITLGAPAIGS